jgi:hypothetical protein
MDSIDGSGARGSGGVHKVSAKAHRGEHGGAQLTVYQHGTLIVDLSIGRSGTRMGSTPSESGIAGANVGANVGAKCQNYRPGGMERSLSSAGSHSYGSRLGPIRRVRPSATLW